MAVQGGTLGAKSHCGDLTDGLALTDATMMARMEQYLGNELDYNSDEALDSGLLWRCWP